MWGGAGRICRLPGACRAAAGLKVRGHGGEAGGRVCAVGSTGFPGSLSWGRVRICTPVASGGRGATPDRVVARGVTARGHSRSPAICPWSSSGLRVSPPLKTVAQQLEALRAAVGRGRGSRAAAGPGCPPVAAAPFPLFLFRGGAPGFTGPEVAMVTRPWTSPARGDPPIPLGQPQHLGPESRDASSLRGRSACWGPCRQCPGREDPPAQL